MILSDIEKRIKDKIERVGTPLKDWDISINYGIKTGCNDAFIISGEKRKELIEQDAKSEEIIRPILRGRNIKKYGYEFADLWLINAHNGIKEKSIKPVNIEDYPAVKKHLELYLPMLEKRTDKGDTPFNLRNCAYLDHFNCVKIIYPEITKYMPFYLDDQQFLVNNKCFIITGQNMYFLVAFLNSSLFKYLFRDDFPELLGGTRELRKTFLEQIMVKQVTNEVENAFRDVVIRCQVLHQDPLLKKECELQIDKMLFTVYGLSKQEQAAIGFIEIQ